MAWIEGLFTALGLGIPAWIRARRQVARDKADEKQSELIETRERLEREMREKHERTGSKAD